MKSVKFYDYKSRQIMTESNDENALNLNLGDSFPDEFGNRLRVMEIKTDLIEGTKDIFLSVVE